MHHRPERLGKLVRETIAKSITRRLEFPGMLVTVTDVAVTEKLDYARVKISVWPPEKAKEALQVMEGERAALQRELLKTIRIRTVPHIAFELDRGAENAAAVEKALLGK